MYIHQHVNKPLISSTCHHANVVKLGGYTCNSIQVYTNVYTITMTAPSNLAGARLRTTRGKYRLIILTQTKLKPFNICSAYLDHVIKSDHKSPISIMPHSDPCITSNSASLEIGLISTLNSKYPITRYHISTFIYSFALTFNRHGTYVTPCKCITCRSKWYFQSLSLPPLVFFYTGCVIELDLSAFMTHVYDRGLLLHSKHKSVNFRRKSTAWIMVGYTLLWYIKQYSVKLTSLLSWRTQWIMMKRCNVCHILQNTPQQQRN